MGTSLDLWAGSGGIESLYLGSLAANKQARYGPSRARKGLWRKGIGLEGELILTYLC